MNQQDSICICLSRVDLYIHFSVLKVHLTLIFFPAKANVLVIWNTSAKKKWIRLNPRFSVPRRNLENCSEKPSFCFATEFKENGSSGYCEVYPRRRDISSPLISLRIMQYTFQKCGETPCRGAIGCCSNTPDLKKDILYNLLAMIVNRLMVK